MLPGSDPQYSLKIHSPVHRPLVWVLLTRHITTKVGLTSKEKIAKKVHVFQSDFAKNEKFITLNVAPSDGKRIYLPDNFTVIGVKINTPHYLTKLEELPIGDSSFTIVVSQLESLNTIHYTLRVCVCVCTCVVVIYSVCCVYNNNNVTFFRFTQVVSFQLLQCTILTITQKRFVYDTQLYSVHITVSVCVCVCVCVANGGVAARIERLRPFQTDHKHVRLQATSETEGTKVNPFLCTFNQHTHHTYIPWSCYIHQNLGTPRKCPL